MAIMNSGKMLIMLSMVAVMLTLFGCAGTMSLEEAKKVSISMDETSLKAPSRRISDILTVLNQPGQFDTQLTMRMKAEATALPPEKADDGTLAMFYHERGEAAAQLGYARQALGDLRLALMYSRKSGMDDPVLLRRLGGAEQGAGNFNNAVELLRQSLARQDNMATYFQLINCYIQMGDLEKAEKTSRASHDFYQGKERTRKGEPNWSREANMSRIQSAVLEAQGRYGEAERYLRDELYIYHERSIKDDRPSAAIMNRIRLSRNLMQQGRPLEAEVEARRALTEALGHGGAESWLTARALEDLARIMLAQGRIADAEQLSRAGIRIYEASGASPDSNMMCAARMFLGNVLSRKGDFTAALKQYDLAREGMRENRYLYETKFIRNRNLMLTLLKAGRRDEAMKVISQTYELNKKHLGEKHTDTIRILGLRAMAHAMTGNDRQAFRDFSAVAPVLMGQGDRADERRNRLHHTILEAYLEFLASINATPREKDLGVKASGEAFRVAAYLGGQGTQEALGESSARAAASYDPDLADLARREQDAQKQIAAMQSILSDALMAPTGQQEAGALETLKGKIASLTKARASLLVEIERRFPKYAEFTNSQAVTEESARKNLRPGEALIVIYTAGEKTYVWAVSQQGEVRFAVAPLGRRELRQRIAHLRAALDPQPGTLGDIPAFDLARAHDLYSKLLKPVELAWANARDLLITVHGPLGPLPLSILPTQPVQLAGEQGELFASYRSVPWLIRKASVTMLPSVNALPALRSLPAGDPARKAFAGFGDPLFSKEQLAMDRNAQPDVPVKAEQKTGGVAETVQLASRGAKVHVRGIRITAKGNLDNSKLASAQLGTLDRLPDTAEELRSIAKVLGANPKESIFLGKDCSEQRIKTMNLGDRKVIAFATHALIPGDLDGLDQPALALSSPEVTGEKENGLLTMGEILKLKLNADWVVLSACNTGAAEGQGAEAISGLGKAFFYAGTRALLVTMWPVETTSARKLVTGTFLAQQEDKTLSRAQALRASMLALIDRETLKEAATGKIISSYAHPLFWAPFVIVGDPGKHL